MYFFPVLINYYKVYRLYTPLYFYFNHEPSDKTIVVTLTQLCTE